MTDNEKAAEEYLYSSLIIENEGAEPLTITPDHILAIRKLERKAFLAGCAHRDKWWAEGWVNLDKMTMIKRAYTDEQNVLARTLNNELLTVAKQILEGTK